MSGADDELVDHVTLLGAQVLRWWPSESDFPLTEGWFAKEDDEPKSPQQLFDIYNRSVGRNSVYLMNVPPTRTGLFAPASNEALAGSAELLAEAYTTNVAIGAPVTVTTADGTSDVLEVADGNYLTSATSQDGSYVVTLPEATGFDRVQLAEDTYHHGQQVSGYTLEARQDGEWRTIGTGVTVGASSILEMEETVVADQVRVTLESTRGTPHLAEVSLWQNTPGASRTIDGAVVDCSVERAGDGSAERPFNNVEQLREVTFAPGATLTFRSGADCGASTATFWGYGTDEAPVTVVVADGDVAPRIGEVALADYLTDYEAQGWDLSALSTPTDPEPEPEPSFSDVGADNQFFTQIEWLAERGISTGWDNGDGTASFRPLEPIARDAMAAFLYRLAGSPEVELPASSPFTDVSPEDQFYEEIVWLHARGISTGWENGDGTASFRPLEKIGRDAMAAFLHRLAGAPAHEAPATSPFTDLTPSTQFYDEITWLVSSGVATGWRGNDGTAIYRPVAPVARDAMAAFLFRYVEAGLPTGE
ncbi:S-layer homology domain-containing protein [Litorihabitans aurantiacus]|uniref:SLH domain-containing protein n=1 Tax=Litorihabitans aurantiacus TaxID=1930061 RepID=A0AA37UQ83_9MICO|nr:S-layer homology domain-containing protein [Litorihabitans aurantiacus]GMA31061.1 hypothetical protein GCM10025875_10530 [Litorihabitans aurantiacus]